MNITASVIASAVACRASPTRTDWWVDLALISQQGTVFSQRTQVVGEKSECEGCFRLQLSTSAEVENPALIFDAEEVDNASQARMELNATVVGHSNSAATISGSLLVRYRLDGFPDVEQTRRFDF